MKRDIKFRAWYEGKMYEVFTYKLSAGMVNITLPRFPFSQDVIPDEIMQYTGLKDKNGKEIYEGDICKSNKGTVSFIVWSLDGWGMNSYYDGGDMRLYGSINYYGVEIIGNIYENPELL